MEKIDFKFTENECSVIMKVIKDYIEAATKMKSIYKYGITLEIGDVPRFFQYEELDCLYYVITKFGGDDYSENKVLDWYYDSEG